MPSGNFVDVSRHRKTTTTSPKKAKALGGRGRNAELHGVYVCASGWCYCKPQPRAWNSAPALQQNSPLPLPVFYPAEQPWQAGLRDAAKHHTRSTASSSPTLPGHCQVLEVWMWGMNFSARTYRERHKTSSTAGWGRCTTHLAALATLLAHWSGTHWKKFCASLNKTSHQHFIVAREKRPKLYKKRCTTNSTLLFLSLYLKLVLKLIFRLNQQIKIQLNIVKSH